MYCSQRKKLDESLSDCRRNAACTTPVVMRERLKDSFDKLQAQQLVTSLTQPTQWISSPVVVTKKDSNNLRTCLDPKDLNRAMQSWDNYHVSTIENVSTRRNGVKVFLLLAVRSGFWQVKLDEPSSYLTTFNKPFGRYRWK